MILFHTATSSKLFPFFPLLHGRQPVLKSNGTSRAAVDDVPEPQDGSFMGPPRLGLVDKDQGSSLAFLRAEMQARCLPVVVPAKPALHYRCLPSPQRGSALPLWVAGRGGAVTMLWKIHAGNSNADVGDTAPCWKDAEQKRASWGGMAGKKKKQIRHQKSFAACRFEAPRPAGSWPWTERGDLDTLLLAKNPP